MGLFKESKFADHNQRRATETRDVAGYSRNIGIGEKATHVPPSLLAPADEVIE